jgi:hypothetical protein
MEDAPSMSAKLNLLGLTSYANFRNEARFWATESPDNPTAFICGETLSKALL